MVIRSININERLRGRLVMDALLDHRGIHAHFTIVSTFAS
mgnify:CR=1 FL=1